MKILHVIPSIASLRGGPSQEVISMVKALINQGIDVEIATTNDNGDDLLDVPLGQLIKYEEVPVWFFPRFLPPMKEFIVSISLTHWLWKNMSNYDLIHTHYLFSYVPTCAGIIARWQKKPYIVETLDHLSPWSLTQSRLKKQIYLNLIEKNNLNCANAIHCTSHQEAENVKNYGIIAPTITVPIAIDKLPYFPEAKKILREQYFIEEQTPIILFMSRIHPKKRPDLLIQSLHKIAKQDQKFHLILAGSGEKKYLNYLQNLAVSLSLNHCVSFTGFVTGDDKNLLLQGSDLFALSSFSENFGIVVAEAMSAGLPVIVTNGVQISSEIATTNSGIVTEGEVNDLSNALLSLLTSPELRQEMGKNGQELVTKRYSWQVIAQKLISVYDCIIQQKKNPEKLLN
jgi:glycosyltransferase involved in cell wall biosynthesis